MTLTRNLGGYWLVIYKQVCYYTFTRNVKTAIQYAHIMNGKPQII